MAVVHVRHALSSMQLQKVVGIDPSMWPYRVHVRHALSSMQLQKVGRPICGRIEYTFVMLYRGQKVVGTFGMLRHALSSMQLQKVVGIDPSMWPYRVHVRHALSSMTITKDCWYSGHQCGRIEYTFVMLYHLCNYKR